MPSTETVAPVVLAVRTQPPPRTPSELYLDLLKKVLTRALLAHGMERHTIQPRGPKSTLLFRLNQAAARFGVEAKGTHNRRTWGGCVQIAPSGLLSDRAAGAVGKREHRA